MRFFAGLLIVALQSCTPVFAGKLEGGKFEISGPRRYPDPELQLIITFR